MADLNEVDFAEEFLNHDTSRYFFSNQSPRQQISDKIDPSD